MIKQRFYTDGQYVMQDGEVYVICSGKHNADVVATALNELLDENGKLKKYNKGQELEIIRLHNLADTMSAVLRELGIYDVYNDEQIENVKRRITND